MKVASMLGLTLSLAILVALGGEAAAQTCQSGCGLQMKSCLQSARTTKLACKLDCRTNAAPTDLRACMHGCRDTFGGAKDVCRGDLRVCITSCTPGGSGGCVGTCGQDLATCAQGVITQAKACVKDCSTVTDRLSCLEDCAAAAKSGGETCASDFTSCVNACGASPSGAFVD